mmetsp:Transcript_60375/g.143904  ORF Transcript_60375/g.143904 Transcript_60375/m.143904 type:complete len:356 (+) Transcript_60375:233-1300(+)
MRDGNAYLEQNLLQMQEETQEEPIDEQEFYQTGDHKVFWDIVKFCSIVAVALGLYGIARGQEGSLKLPMVLATQGSILLLASLLASYQWAVGSGAPRPKFPPGALLLMSWCAALSSLLWVRMAASDHFRGNFADFNFGERCHNFEVRPGEKCIPNKALELDNWNTYGHFAQGLLAWFLFPAVERLLYRCKLALPGRVASLGIVVYPIYSWLKRIRTRSEYFATSSFVKTGAEWSTGFFMAVTLGFLCTAAEGGTAPQLARARRHSYGPDRRSVRSGDGMCWITWWCRLERARQGASVLLAICTIAAGVQICTTWDTRAPESDQPFLGKRGPLWTAALLLVPLTVLGLVLFCGRET